MLRYRVLAATLAILSALLMAEAAPAQVLPHSPDSPQKPEGRWSGAIEAAGQRLEMSIVLKREGETWTGSLDVPAQGIRGMPLAELVVEPAKVSFALANVPGDPRYEGVIQSDEIIGTFNQSGAEVPLTFKYGLEITKPNRPQEPEPPYPYEAREVSFESLSEGVKLAGTFTVPEGEGPFPAVVLISGSGAQNRDEEVFQHRPFLVLADRLTRAGIAVLRYDDRGVGGSTGDANAANTHDLSMDAEAAVRFLRKQPQVKTDAVGLVGHSEGGIIAPMVAARSEDVSFIVLLAGPGVPGDEVLIRQIREGAIAEGQPPDAAQAASSAIAEMVELIKTDADEAAIREAIERLIQLQSQPNAPVPPGTVDMLYKQFAGAWFKYFLSHDPAEALRKVNVPVLVLQGELDRQVNAEVNTAAIRAALAHNPIVRVEVLEGLNHLFQPAKTGGGSEYAQIEITMDESVPPLIAAWVKQVAAP